MDADAVAEDVLITVLHSAVGRFTASLAFVGLKKPCCLNRGIQQTGQRHDACALQVLEPFP